MYRLTYQEPLAVLLWTSRGSVDPTSTGFSTERRFSKHGQPTATSSRLLTLQASSVKALTNKVQMKYKHEVLLKLSNTKQMNMYYITLGFMNI